MRALAILGSRIVLLSTLCALFYGTDALAAAPCASAQSGNAAQNAAQAAQQVVSAVNNLKSIFGGNKPQATTNSPPPCTPAPTATLASASAPSAAPAAAQAAQVPQANANANAPLPPTAELASSLIPSAPAGGLDPSKLPDILGIHIGEPTSQVVDRVKTLYPTIRNNGGTVISGNLTLATPHYAYTNDPPYTSSLAVEKLSGFACSPSDCLSNDRMDAIFSGPPDTRVVQLKRSIKWPVGKEPTTDTVKGAVIKKYGQTYLASVGGATLTWLFDEEGNPMATFPQIFNGCSGPVANGAGPNPGLFNSYLGVTPNVTQGDLDRIVKARCGIKIWVQAQIGATSAGTAVGLDLTINEIAFDLRDAFAAENYIRQAKNAQGNQQLKNAQQQAGPKF